jgi:hypothetical protein
MNQLSYENILATDMPLVGQFLFEELTVKIKKSVRFRVGHRLLFPKGRTECWANATLMCERIAVIPPLV